MTSADPFSSALLEALPRLRRFCRSLTGSASDADDLAQTTIERALRNASSFQPGTRLDRWLIRIAHNAWIDTVRSPRHRLQHDPVDMLIEQPGEDGVATMEARSRSQAVRQAMMALPEDQRILVSLITIEGLSYREAAELLGIPIGTIMSRLARARAAVAQRLAPMGDML